ncbi:glycosyltransferase family 2 protein [uncultured Duncaniella sp.]|uniref:glycosyltransferase family 2 protein n=1 Tax=uncultured Duncaniella sp. TaxID=2768039 RepID=UPI002635EBA2|nr:glycosyltransferase family 2 protein [uncultured Duncaniella sp.]
MVSIIIPAYNAERYLREALESALAQTYRDIEVIVVDDGSTDSTPEIIRDFAARDHRIKAIRQPNGGLSAARNAALDIASGEWLVFLDSDDLLYPDSVARLLEAAENSGCNLVHGAWTRGLDLNNASTNSGEKLGVEALTWYELVERILYQTSDLIPTAWGKIYRRDVFSNKRFREGITYEDLDIFYWLGNTDGRIAVTSTPVYFYRDNPSSITNTFTPSRLDVLAVTERLEEYIAANHPSLLPAARDRRLSANFNMLCLLAIHDCEGRYADVADRCFALIKSYRRASLFNPRVRLKNKIGILLSYLGRGGLRIVSPLVYGRKAR